MTQTELIKKISARFFLTQPEEKEIIKYVIEQITTELQKGERVYLRGFGSFKTVTRKSKKVRHPKTKKIIIIPERQDVEFKTSKRLLKEI